MNKVFNSLQDLADIKPLLKDTHPTVIKKAVSGSKEFTFIYHTDNDKCIIQVFTGTLPEKHSKLPIKALSYPSAISRAKSEIRKKNTNIRDFHFPFKEN